MSERVIVHIDLDCFYCQVEHRRLGIDDSVPLAVQQWDGLIAVNYAARAAGVARFNKIKEAKAACPGIQLIHVATIRGSTGDDAVDPDCINGHPAPDRNLSKACLFRYREASMKVLNIFERYAKGCVERASIDEAYFDLTDIVTARLKASSAVSHLQDDPTAEEEEGDGAGVDGSLPAAPLTEIVGSGDTSGPFDRRLLVGAELVSTIRQAVSDELGYTCSAGLAHNKMLAKLASSMRKPNRQSIVPASAVSGLLSEVKLTKLRNLGGKLGEQVLQMLTERQESQGQASHRSLPTSTVDAGGAAPVASADNGDGDGADNGDGDDNRLVPAANLAAQVPDNPKPERVFKPCDLAAVDESDLLHRFGAKTGRWLHRVCRGVDDDPVLPNDLSVKSMMACKSFPSKGGGFDKAEVVRWTKVLCTELAQRMVTDREASGRRPRSLAVVYRGGSSATADRSKTIPMPGHAGAVPSADALHSAVVGVLERLPDLLPCNRVAVGATDFAEPPQQGRSSLKHFFQNPEATSSTATGTRFLDRDEEAGTTSGQMIKAAGVRSGAESRFFAPTAAGASATADGIQALSETVVPVEATKLVVQAKPGTIGSFIEAVKAEPIVNNMRPAWVVESETAAAAAEPYYVCLECRQQVLISEKQSHDDLHFAFKMSNSVSPLEGRAAAGASSQRGGGKKPAQKRKGGGKLPDARQQGLKSMFQKSRP